MIWNVQIQAKFKFEFNKILFYLFAASSPPLGAILSALIAGFVLQKLGRKKTMLLSVFLFLTAFLTLATSKIHEIPFVMIAARALMGCAVGFAMPSASIYVSLMPTTYYSPFFLVFAFSHHFYCLSWAQCYQNYICELQTFFVNRIFIALLIYKQFFFVSCFSQNIFFL